MHRAVSDAADGRRGVDARALAATLRERAALATHAPSSAVLLHPVMAVAGLAIVDRCALLRIWDARRGGRATAPQRLLLVAALGGGVADRRPLRCRNGGDGPGAQSLPFHECLVVRGLDPRARPALMPADGRRIILRWPDCGCRAERPARHARRLVITLHRRRSAAPVIFTQAQPWRIEWLGSSAGALYCPTWRLASGAMTQRRGAAAAVLAALRVPCAGLMPVPHRVAALALLNDRRSQARHAQLI